MAWPGDEQGVEDGNIIELYKFEGSDANYFYTSWQQDVDYSGDTYVAAPTNRASFGGRPIGEEQTFEVTLPVSKQLVQDYAFDANPPTSLNLTVYRSGAGSSGPFVQWNKGSVINLRVKGDLATIVAASVFDEPLAADVPSVWLMSFCNHRLGDNNCGVDTDALKVSTTVSSISSDGLEITLASDGGNADQWSRAGYLRRVSDGALRLVIDHTGNVMTLAHPFRTLAGSDSVELFPGCAHNIQTCFDKFNNVINYGGFPYIPGKNIFRLQYGIRGV